MQKKAQMHRLRRCRKKERHSGFTLIELMTVIVVMGIIFFIALPALNNISGASKLETAANAVHSMMNMARQYAIVQNQPTYVVFNDEYTTSDPDMAYRSIAVFTIDINTASGIITPNEGHFLKEWETLPHGLVFDPDVNPTQKTKNVFLPDGGLGWKGGYRRHNILKIEGKDHIVIGFYPKGKPSFDYRTYIAEGFYDPQNWNLVKTSRQCKEVRTKRSGAISVTDMVYNDSDRLVRLDGEAIDEGWEDTEENDD